MKCYTTILQEDIQDDSLPLLNTLVISVNQVDMPTEQTQRIRIVVLQPVNVKTVGSYMFSVDGREFVNEATLTYNAVHDLYLQNGNYELHINNKNFIQTISYPSGLAVVKCFGFDVSQCNYLDDLAGFYMSGAHLYGELVLSNPSLMGYMQLSASESTKAVDNSIINIDQFEFSTGLHYIHKFGGIAYGNIENLGRCTIMTELWIPYQVNVTGDLTVLAANQVANGRTSGTLMVQASKSGCTDGGNPLTTAYNRSKGGSGWIYNIIFTPSEPSGFRIEYA